MEKKKEQEFTVTDRRRFTSEGEATPSEANSREASSKAPQEAEPAPSPAVPSPQAEQEAPNIQAAAAEGATQAAAGEAEYPMPSPEERKAQEDAFKASASRMDKELEGRIGGAQAEDLQMSFERFVASIYMSALLQLGLMREQDGAAPPVDLVGARQTIDTLALLGDKTKGNLTPQEENLLQNCLYELRMAYVEVTNALTRAPQPGAGGPGNRK